MMLSGFVTYIMSESIRDGKLAQFVKRIQSMLNFRICFRG